MPRGPNIFKRALLPALLMLALSATPALASSSSVTAKTNKGGRCVISTEATSSGGLFPTISYSVAVPICNSHYGIRKVDAANTLYNTNDLVPSTLNWAPSASIPYVQSGSFQTNLLSGTVDRSRIDTTVVLKARRGPRTRRLEHWRKAPRRCIVTTTKVTSDTLKCTFQNAV